MSLLKRCIAEFIGTFWLVLGGCGSAVLAASFTEQGMKTTGNAAVSAVASSGIGVFGVSVAFGLTVLTMAYAIGHISGCHLNPAVSFGLWAGKRFPASDLLPYIVAQVTGAIASAGTIAFIAAQKKGFDGFSGSNPLATNGFGEHSPAGYSMLACFVVRGLLPEKPSKPFF